VKICHVITRLIVGGAQENTILTCRGLAERGHEVTLIAGPETGPEGSLWGETSAAGYQTMVLDDLRRAVRPVRDARAFFRLRAVFRQLRPDVVHTHSSKAGILARHAAAAAGVPVIVHTIHGMSFNRTQFFPTRALYRGLERRAARVTTGFVAVADAMIEQSVAAGIAPRDRFLLIRSGMETNRFARDARARVRVRAQWGVGDEQIVVGTVARLFRNKGYEEILQAMPTAVAARPDLRFVWIGHGPHRGRYERRLLRLGLRDRVHFAGLVPPGQIPEVLNGVDILLHASRWEGLPRAVVQALLTEVPAVCFDNDGAPEVVLNGQTGILVPFGHAAGLAEAVVRLADDAELRRRLGRQGREHCLWEFDWRRMVHGIDALYQRLISGRIRV
jgi:glycosyltransferase involved in cell wall biosynthesis